MSETKTGLRGRPQRDALVCIVDTDGFFSQATGREHTIADVAYITQATPADNLGETEPSSPIGLSHGLTDGCSARSLLFPNKVRWDANTAELAALGVWSGKQAVRLPDGSVAISAKAARNSATLPELLSDATPLLPAKREKAVRSSTLLQHLSNAELLSWRSWLFHPLRSLSRAIPLRVKQEVNRAAGTALFDLTFYVQFQPQFVQFERQSRDVNDSQFEPLRYSPRYSAAKQRVAIVIPQLGPGGAESVLLDLVSSLDRKRCEILILATQSEDERWRGRWASCADHIYDLAQTVPATWMTATVYSIITNWKCDIVLVQNTMYGYAALPAFKRARPTTHTLDVVHAIDERWNQAEYTAPFDASIDLRLTMSTKAQAALIATGTPASRVKLLHSGVPMDRFKPGPVRGQQEVKRILYAGRLDAFKRPLLLVDIAARLRDIRGGLDFQFVIAGDGPEKARFLAAVQRNNLGQAFELLGLVPDLAPVYAGVDVLILPSRTEGRPLVIIEALACARPVVASNVGDIPELLDSCGIVVDIAPGEIEQYAESLNRLLNDPQLRQAMGNAGRKKVAERHDPQVAAAAYGAIFEELLRREAND